MKLSRRFIQDKGAQLLPRKFLVEDYEERVIQIGEGNFLRGFADWMIHQLNKNGLFQGRVVVVAPRPTGHKRIRELNEQNGLYTTLLRGLYGGKNVEEIEVVSAISRAIDPYEDWGSFLKCAENMEINVCISNTTESGITYHKEDYKESEPILSFPGKLTAYLYHRYVHFSGNRAAGMTIVPCELIENNGEVLKNIIFKHAADWGLSSDFNRWIEECNHFCNTLVDRIVTGFPSDEEKGKLFAKIGYEDSLFTIGEPFHLWAIQNAADLPQRWPFASLGLNVKYVDDITPYRVQKIRILNGTHTSMAYLAYFLGFKTVRQAVLDPLFGQFICEEIYDEIVPTVKEELKEVKYETIVAFTDSVLERFKNPHLEHKISDLMLNGLSKLNARIIPTIKTYVESRKEIPQRLALSFAAFLLFYRKDENEEKRPLIRDDLDKVAILQAVWEKELDVGLENTISAILGLEGLFGFGLNQIEGLASTIVSNIHFIREYGIAKAVEMSLHS